MAWVRDTFAALEPYIAPKSYVNYLADDESDLVANAYGPNLDRLVEIKRQLRPGQPLPAEPQHRSHRLTGTPGHALPSRRSATDLATRRARVSSVLAPSTDRTMRLRLLFESESHAD